MTRHRGPGDGEKAATLSNDTNKSQPEDEDVALAQILQQQERAFLELRGAPQGRDEGPPPGLTEDEELAWRLMREEEALFQHRMMAMAGLEPAGSSGALGIDSGSVEDELVDHQTSITTKAESARVGRSAQPGRTVTAPVRFRHHGSRKSHI